MTAGVLGMFQKIKYFGESALKRAKAQPVACPSCGGLESELVDRKYLVTELRKCRTCKLLFRYPTDSASENFDFYQHDYTQGFTTDCPDDAALSELVHAGFVDSDRDYSSYVEILRALRVPGDAKVIEFGASWGYGVWQFARAGYEASGFEISRPRARYAREKLGVQVFDSTSEIKEKADVFFSSHVLEHVPSIHKAISLARELVHPNGLFVALTPNGSTEFRQQNPSDFHKLWNRVHPNFVTAEFYQHLFEGQSLLLGSSPHDLHKISEWGRRGRMILSLGGIELLCIAVFSGRVLTRPTP